MLKTLNKKHILSVTLASVASLWIAADANAAVNGAYLGGQLGYSNVHQDNFSKNEVTVIGDTTLTMTNTANDRGIAGRVFGGYQFNNYIAAELGYTRFHNATNNLTITSSDPETGTETLKANGTIKTDAVDLTAKGILPLSYGFNVYGKAGVAYLRGQGSVKVTNTFGPSYTYSETEHKIYPTFGAGVSYDLTQNVSTDVSWNRIQKVGNSSDLNSTDLFAAGLAYHFG